MGLLKRAVFFVPLLASLASCGGGSSARFECPDDTATERYVWDGTVCSLRRDGFNFSVSSIAPASDGSNDLYAVGSFTHFKNTAITNFVRLNNDGSLDTGFSPGTGFFSPQVAVSANDGSGDIYVGGYLSYNGPTLPIRGIARLDSDGSLDSGFDTGAGIGRNVRTIVPANDGSGDVYVGGLSSGPGGAPTFGNGPVRLNNDGSVDTGFNPGFRGGEGSIALATDGSGDIYVSRESAPYIARLNDDGSLDTDFDTGISGFDRWVNNIAVATDGSGDIYVAGSFSEYNGSNTPSLVRLNSDGSLDTAFVVDTGIYRFQGLGFILPADDGSGDVYVDGANSTTEAILRLNDDGSVDTGFNIGDGFRGNASLGDAAFATDGSGDIYVAGDFTRYNSTPVPMLMRLTTGGVLVR
ncbi:MAG: hypothetical protein QNJ85_03330 [Gammaproteobacteria bacterium]|nr:hypothetical protein [Gammaproteobacteria bacterium]